MLLNASPYVRFMMDRLSGYFLIENDDLLEKHNTIWEMGNYYLGQR